MSPSHDTPSVPAPVFANVLEMIGHTPMLEFRKLVAQRASTGGARLFGKMELMNPASSIKDRIGLSMIEAAEKDGRLDPRGNPPPTIIEATAGNTGVGLALVAGQRGYKLKVVMPDKMSQEKIQHLRAMGAEVIMTRSDVAKGHPEYYQEVAAELAKKTPNSLYTDQFSNPDNAAAHYHTTAPEIWAQIAAATNGGTVDAVVLGVGSAGTLAGIGKYVREHSPNTKIILADPAGSILAPLVNEGKHVEPGSWLVEGMGEDFIPSLCDLSLVSEAFAVTDGEAFHAARELLRVEGVLAGSSTGCILHAALEYCRKQPAAAAGGGGKPLNVVTLVCDSGAKYLSKMFNDFWMIDHGFIKREKRDNLADLIARRHWDKEDYTLKPSDPIKQVIKRMQMYAVSQMVVTAPPPHGDGHDTNNGDCVIGIIDESDILLAVTHDKAAFEKPVSDFMTRRLETIRPEASVNDLMPIFRADRVAIVVDELGTMGEKGRYLGLITKIDLINYLRGQLVN